MGRGERSKGREIVRKEGKVKRKGTGRGKGRGPKEGYSKKGWGENGRSKSKENVRQKGKEKGEWEDKEDRGEEEK